MARAHQEVKADTHVLQLGDIVEFPWPPPPDQGDGTQHGVYLAQSDDELHDVYVRGMQKPFRVRRCDLTRLIPVGYAVSEARQDGRIAGWREALDEAILTAKDAIPRTSGSVVLTLMALKARGPK